MIQRSGKVVFNGGPHDGREWSCGPVEATTLPQMKPVHSDRYVLAHLAKEPITDLSLEGCKRLCCRFAIYELVGGVIGEASYKFRHEIYLPPAVEDRTLGEQFASEERVENKWDV